MTSSKVSILPILAVFLVFGCGREAVDPAPRSPLGSASSDPSGLTMVEESPEGLLAPRNGSRVPRVVGMTVPEAARKLRTRGYGCAVIEEEDRRGAGPRRVVSQDLRPGRKGFEGQLVHLAVSRPFPAGTLPFGCVDQRDEPRATTPSG